VVLVDDASKGLTSDTVPGSGTNLYTYEFATGRLTDLTPAKHAEVQSVVGVSKEGDTIYFTAMGSLAAGATQGQSNPYVWHPSGTTFLDVLTGASLGAAQISPNGAFLAFVSWQNLTGYDNLDLVSKRADPEIFLYDAATNSLSCASCNPSGESPDAGGASEWDIGILGSPPGGAPHRVFDNGRLFFTTGEKLLPADTDGTKDVYEYEGGQLHLMSSGTSSSDSLLLDASEGGYDVFFLTRQKLLPQDTNEEALNIYDARVNGGFPDPVSPPACITADACRTPVSPQPAIFGAPASQTFSGAGNLAQPATAKANSKGKAKGCRKGHVKKKGRCVKPKRGKRAKKSDRIKGRR
jgi:hypothetical protein